MQIKRFEAKTMAEALQRIKAELGPEAVILSARSIRKGSILPGLRKGVEVTAAVDPPSYDVRDVSRAVTSPARAREAYARCGALPQPEARTLRADPSLRPESSEVPPAVRAGVVKHPIYRRLTAQGVREELAREITAAHVRLCRKFPASDPTTEGTNLRWSLEKTGFAARGLNLAGRAQKRIVFVGASGVGKTTTVLKLAVRQARDHGQHLALVSLDDQRLGAWDALRLVAEALQLRLTTGSLQADAREILREHRAADLVLIDTPAIGPGDERRLSELAGFLRQVKPSEICFLASASGNEADQFALIRHLAPLAVTGIGFTKLDESTRPAGILNLLDRSGKPALLFSSGRRIPEDLADGSLAFLASQISENAGPGASAPVVPAAEFGREFREQAPYMANGNSEIYHRRDCKWTQVMKAENIVCFETAAEAESKEFKPCRACCRDRLNAEFRGRVEPIIRQAFAGGR
jgi:flagellar biosynthesis protein FlhF